MLSFCALKKVINIKNINKTKIKKKGEKQMKEKQKGITLIALVITIIVLLILAGVSIATLTGQNGVLTQAQNAKEETEESKEKEEVRVAYMAAKTAKGEDIGELVLESEMNEELKNIGSDGNATGTTNLTVTFPNGNVYTINQTTGEISGPEKEDNEIIYTLDNAMFGEYNINFQPYNYEELILEHYLKKFKEETTEEDLLVYFINKNMDIPEEEKYSSFEELVQEGYEETGIRYTNAKDICIEVLGMPEEMYPEFITEMRSQYYEEVENSYNTIYSPDGEDLYNSFYGHFVSFRITEKGDYTYKVQIGKKEYYFTINIDRYEVVSTSDGAAIYDFDEKKYLNILSAVVTVNGIEKEVTSDKILNTGDHMAIDTHEYFYESETNTVKLNVETEYGKVEGYATRFK